MNADTITRDQARHKLRDAIRQWQTLPTLNTAEQVNTLIDELLDRAFGDADHVYRLRDQIATDTAEIIRLRGEAGVLRELLRQADQVLDHIEPDDTDEASALADLQRQIRGAVA